jgi:serine/threonine-protein kinase HipA
MSLLDSSDDPQADRERLMRSACFTYLLAATDSHAKNYSLLYTRGAERFNMRLSPLYDVASAWPYPRKLPAQKMKLAMRIGRHYRLKEIQPRHFAELAKGCGFPQDAMLAILRDLTLRLPDLAVELLEDVQTSNVAKNVLARLVEGLTTQCKATSRMVEHSS